MEQQVKQRHLLKKVFLAILFLTLFAGEVLFSIYGNYQNSDETAFREEQEAIVRWRQTDSLAVFKRKELAASLATIGTSSKQKTLQNQKVLDAGRIERKLYDDKLIADTKMRAELQAKYDTWEARELRPIRDLYARKRSRSSESTALGFLSGLQLGLVASLTAIGLAYLATRARTKDWMNILLTLSFLVQIVACTTAWHGLMAKYDDVVRATMFAIVFSACAPAVYHFGLLDWKDDEEIVKVVERIEQSSLPEHAITLKETKTTHHEFSVTIWSKDANGFKDAMVALAKEIQGGNGAGLMAKTAAYFGVLRGQVSRAVKQASNNERITVPERLLSPPSSVEVS